MVNVLKKSIGAITIIKQILDHGVSLIVGKLLASVPAVKKQITKAISEDEVIQFHVNSLGLSKVLKTSKPYFWYSMRSSKAKIYLENSSKVTALLDMGAKINIMTKKLIENINLAMR